MLELQSVTWQNFLSYGDYETTVDLANLGQCLITGEVHDDDTNRTERSNGAGKSTIPSAIQWALFGRTMHSSNPGSKVVNWFTGKDCWVRLNFKNGDTITRTRSVNGHNELIFVREGSQTSLVSDTLSTTKNQQQQMAKEFGLDWDIFCGSVFFNQYGKPWMEMADQQRKKAIERILHIDKFIYYAQSAKTKRDAVDNNIQSIKQKIENIEHHISRLRSQIDMTTRLLENFEGDKKQKIISLFDKAKEEKRKRDEIELPELDVLSKKWDAVEKIKEILRNIRTQCNEYDSKIAKLDGQRKSIVRTISLWDEKAGKICLSCEQEIPHEHIGGKIKPLNDELESVEAQLSELNEKRAKVINDIRKAEAALNDRLPTITMSAARDAHAKWKMYDESVARLVKSAQEVKDQTNPHNDTITELEKEIESYNVELESLNTIVRRDTLLSKHYNYIYKTYNDRTKIKSFVYQEHIPFINNRLEYYLEAFGLDISIELTSALGIQSTKWGYDFESGGERKRTDVAFMLAMFDFHEQMYGRQCNILVLDEVDGRLDNDGIDSLVNIIKNDIASKVETVLIISHRPHMQDVFSGQILVKRINRFSTIEQVLT